PDGKIVGVGTNNTLYTRDTLTSEWKQIPNSGPVIGVAVMPDGKIVGVGTNNTLYTRDTLTSEWKQIPNSGSVIGVTVMPDGKLVGIGMNNRLYSRDSLTSGWKYVSNNGSVLSITVMPDGKIVGVGGDNRLYIRDTLTSKWNPIPNSGSVIAVTCSVPPKATTPLEETKQIEQIKPTEETKPIEQTKPTEPIGLTGPTDQVSKPIKLGPTGGSISGTDFQILPKDTAPQSRLKKVFVNAGWAIDALQVEYENPASIPGETYLSDLVGGRGGTKEEFSTPVGDYLTKISGTWGMSAPGRPKQEIVTIQFETKKGVKSPVFGGKHGKQEVEPFVLEAPEGQEIIGFFGSYGGGQNLLVSLGIYCQTVTTLAKLEPSNPQTPSNNEAVTPKEQSSSIKPETLTPLEPSNPQTPSNNEAVTAEEQSSSIKPETLTPSEPSNPQTSESTQDKNMSETLSKPDTTEPTKPSNTTKKKRLVVCCDGTWNELATSYPTNVVKFARLVKYIANDQTPQIVHYISGCGTAEDADLIERLGGGAFGWGIDRIIQDAYRFLCMNYDVEAEDEIYLVGFSRGAYTVRCLAGMIYNCGLLSRSKIRELPKAYELYRNSKIKPNDPEAQKFREDNSKKIDSEKDYLQGRVPIKMLGCWDTVGALGVPDLTPWLPLAKLWNRKYEFFDARLSPIVENAFRAVAIDEKRRGFPSSGMERSDKNPEQVVKEVFFAGEHGCIGGGTEEYRGLSDFTLQWMIHEAKKLGLEFDSTENYREEFQIKPEPTTKFDNSVTGVYALAGEGWRPIESSKVAVHYSVVERLKADPNYRPRNLDSLLNNLLP
ncbi:MAG: DUF2235 domain-containing protein, partial [Microcystis sp. M04BS1]|nr:DUF2235 domain-containing protein [Microcystis sp. M04BS1]